ncbi:MAG: ThuA domain-containing protein [Actinomycetota bacterium]|nr:ThuA domain-containing protein [Actinomycetota bacterium]
MATPARCTSGRVEVAMVVGGRWHDLDFARRELLALVGDHDAVRCSVHSDYSDIRRLSSVDAVIAYTCDVRPTAAEAAALASMLHEGGRLLALHATNSAIDPPPDEGPRIFRTPNAMPEFTALLGNRFLAHPKIGPFLIEPVQVEHPLVSGVTSFTTVDEIYVSELAADLDVVLDVEYVGPTPGFEKDHVEQPRRHPVLFSRAEGAGEVMYFTLGHCRGRFDVRDLGIDDLGATDRVAWDSAEYRLILRRSVAWAVHGHDWIDCPAMEDA